MAQKFFIKIENSDEWRSLLGKVLFKTFFHNIEWEEFLEKNLKWLKFERYLYKNLALLSLARVGEKLVSHPFCEYGGPLPLAEKINYEQFKRDLFSEFKSRIKISLHPRFSDFFQNEPGAVFDPSGRVSYWLAGEMDLRKTTRHEIEKASLRGLVLESSKEKELKSFYSLHIKNAKKHRIPAYPFSFFQYFLRSRDAEIILAKFENKIIAGSVFLLYDKFVHYFQNAVDERYKNFGANYLILSKRIQKCLDENKIFDLGGTRSGSPLQIFKEGWGGKEHSIPEIKNYSEERQLRKSKLRNILGFMPPFLLGKVSPYLLKYKL